MRRNPCVLSSDHRVGQWKSAISSVVPGADMTRLIAAALVLCGSLCLPLSSHAQARCTRADLQSAVDNYLASQAKGVTATLRLAVPVKYIENLQDSALEKGIVRMPLEID